MLTPKADRALVEKYLSRLDEQSFRELYRRHSPAMFALALRISDTEADAEDALQETWIRACKLIATFEWKSTLRTWLIGILINCVREVRRKRERRSEESLPGELSPQLFVSEQSAGNLEEAIRGLPSGYRQVFVLHDVEGYTHEEIGRMLDINVGTAKSQLHHARKFIRTLLLAEQPR